MSTSEYAGVYVGFAEVGVVDATAVELRLNRADGTTYSTHAKAPVLDAVNANNAPYGSGGTVVTLGSRTSSSWDPQGGSWTSASRLADTNPVTVLITLAGGEILTRSIEQKSSIGSKGIEDDIYPAAMETSVPTISGAAKVGETLTASPGTWADEATLSYQWYADGVAITGATSATLLLAPAQWDTVITVDATGAKPGLVTTTRTSEPTVKVAAAALTAPTPSVTGSAKVGSTLTAVPGTWKAGASTDVTLTYQWYASNAPIAGATESRYTLTAADAGKSVHVRITGASTGYTTLTKSSAARNVAPGTLTSAKPKISGKARVGKKLKAVTGTWKAGTSKKVTFTYRWYANGKAIAKATKSTYKVKAKDRGKKLTVKVTGSAPGYKSITKISKAKKIAR